MSARPLIITFADGTIEKVQPTLEDRLKFETTLRRNKNWGDLKDNSLKLHPFLAWSAAHRTGKTTLTWDQFTTGETAALDVVPEADPEDAAEEEALEVDEVVGKGTRKARSTTSR